MQMLRTELFDDDVHRRWNLGPPRDRPAIDIFGEAAAAARAGRAAMIGRQHLIAARTRDFCPGPVKRGASLARDHHRVTLVADAMRLTSATVLRIQGPTSQPLFALSSTHRTTASEAAVV